MHNRFVVSVACLSAVITMEMKQTHRTEGEKKHQQNLHSERVIRK